VTHWKQSATDNSTDKIFKLEREERWPPNAFLKGTSNSVPQSSREELTWSLDLSLNVTMNFDIVFISN
jgi:hypothetical protein